MSISDAALMGRMRLETDRMRTGNLEVTFYPEAHGSFHDIHQANDFVNQVLKDNKDAVDEVADGRRKDKTLEKRFGYPTGREAYRPSPDVEPYMRTTYGVRVVIEHDRRIARGYRLRTALPFNNWGTQRDGRKSIDGGTMVNIDIPEDFVQLCRLYYPGSAEDYATMEEWLASVVKNRMREENLVLRAFLTELLTGAYSEEDLQAVWRSTGPSYQFAGPDAMRGVMTIILEEVEKELG